MITIQSGPITIIITIIIVTHVLQTFLGVHAHFGSAPLLLYHLHKRSIKCEHIGTGLLSDRGDDTFECDRERRPLCDSATRKQRNSVLREGGRQIMNILSRSWCD